MDDAVKNARYNVFLIEQEIEKLSELHSQHQYREFWTHTRQIVEMFKTLDPLPREDRERLWSSYSGLCEVVRGEMKLWQEEAKSNASKIEHEIENLRYNHLDQNAPNISPIRACLKIR